MSYLDKSIVRLANNINSGKLKATQVIQESLNIINQTNPANHSILEINSCALEQAKNIDKLVESGKNAGKLAGVPFAAKDNFLTYNTNTTAASHILDQDNPFIAPYQATAIERLEAEGAIMVAKTNMDAFAHGSSTENSDFGSTKNPINNQYVPGGSSGGSAAAVASGQVSFALGTDTGGSIRLPASFCGVVGLKPTYGLISRYGVIAMASSTDVVGLLTKDVNDASILLDILAGKDPKDATTIERDKNSYTDNKININSIKIGIIKEYLTEGIDPQVKKVIIESIEKIKKQGIRIEEVKLAATKLVLPCYYILVPAEISSNLARYDGIKYGYSAKEAKNLIETYYLSRSKGFGAEAKRRIMIGTYVLSSGYYDAYYKKAQITRSYIIQEFNKAFNKYDVLIGPTSPTVAFKIGQKNKDPLSMYLSDIMTAAVNLVGCPAISLPCGLVNNLPVGLQIIASSKNEYKLMAIANSIEIILNSKGLK